MADTEYVRKDRVVAAEDVAGVPEGTGGVIVMVTGMTWIRYRVLFDNGMERNLVDGHYLRRAAGKKAHR